MNLPTATGAAPARRDKFDRVSDIVQSAILGMAGGTGVASIFVSSLPGVVTGAVLGLVVNAAFAWVRPGRLGRPTRDCR